MSLLQSLLPFHTYLLLVFVTGIILGSILAYLAIFIFNLHIRKERELNLYTYGILLIAFTLVSMSIMSNNFEKVTKGEAVYTSTGIIEVSKTRYILNKGIVIIDKDFDLSPTDTITVKHKDKEYSILLKLNELNRSQLSNITYRLKQFENYQIGKHLDNEDMLFYIQHRLQPMIQEELDRLNDMDINEAIDVISKIISKQTRLDIELEVKE